MNRYRAKTAFGPWKKNEIVRARPAPFACMRIDECETITKSAFEDLFEAVPYKPHLKVGDVVKGTMANSKIEVEGKVVLFKGVMCVDDGSLVPWRLSSIRNMRHVCI